MPNDTRAFADNLRKSIKCMDPPPLAKPSALKELETYYLRHRCYYPNANAPCPVHEMFAIVERAIAEAAGQSAKAAVDAMATLLEPEA